MKCKLNFEFKSVFDNRTKLIHTQKVSVNDNYLPTKIHFSDTATTIYDFMHAREGTGERDD